MCKPYASMNRCFTRVILSFVAVALVLFFGYPWLATALPRGSVAAGSRIVFDNEAPKHHLNSGIWLLARPAQLHRLWLWAGARTELLAASSDGDAMMARFQRPDNQWHYVVLYGKRCEDVPLTTDDDVFGWNPKADAFMVWRNRSREVVAVDKEGSVTKTAATNTLGRSLRSRSISGVAECDWRPDGSGLFAFAGRARGAGRKPDGADTMPGLTVISADGKQRVLPTSVFRARWLPRSPCLVGLRINDAGRDEVVQIDSNTGRSELVWRPPLPGPFYLSGAPVIHDIACDPDGRHVYVSYHESDDAIYGRLVVIDLVTGRVADLLRNCVRGSRIFSVSDSHSLR